ncbi:MAG: hypothetical protein FWE48_05375 [Coriobacteriia bacterium]|nr:hypothetical protein [Coriobacteriia bacterium]
MKDNKTRRIHLRVTEDDYQRLKKLASKEGSNPTSVAYKLMLEAMEPQIFNENKAAVEAMLKEAALQVMDDQTRRLLNETRRHEVSVLAILYAMRAVVTHGFDISEEQFNMHYLEPARKQAAKDLLVELKRLEDMAHG